MLQMKGLLMHAHRILTTHTGSLGRAPELRDMLLAKTKREHVDEAEFDAAVHRAVADVVKRQCEVGLDIINDGEQSKTGFAQYVHERLQGFEGEPVRRVISLEAREFPMHRPAQFGNRPAPGRWLGRILPRLSETSGI